MIDPAPLSGLRVLDLSRALAGPLCGMILGDLGAEVIKVENPEGGDETRAWGPPEIGGESGYYLAANRNKRGITVNIRSPEGAELIRALADVSDILIENFGTAVPSRYGFEWPVLHARNPRLIYCAITGFSPGTRYDGVPGYDFVIQAMSGLMSITGPAEGEPHKVGVAVVDTLTGLYAGNAVLAALHERDRTGEGRRVEVALLDAALASLANVASNFLITGTRPRRWGNAHANLTPYSTYTAANGEIAIGVGNDGQFRRLAEVLGMPELAEDERFRTNPDRVRNREALTAILNLALARHPTAHWVAALQAVRVPAGPVNHVDQIFADPYIEEAEMVAHAPHPTAGEVPLVRNPLLVSGARLPVTRPPPTLGQHTGEVLREVLGLDEEAIRRLREVGAL
jgi:crotonobetainyl-CoA:carnitine CoA-transferase CaiB-like acyl-CoA transferase